MKQITKEIKGNTEGIRDSLLERLKALFDIKMERDEFCTPELVEALAAFTGAIKREIAVYIGRDGVINGISIGEGDRVSLTEGPGRRGARRLSGLRLIHTHPSGSGALSRVDLNALDVLRFDSVAAIGELDSKAVDFYAAFLGGDEPVGIYGPYRAFSIPQNELVERIYEAERAVLAKKREEEQRAERALLVGMERGDGGAYIEELRQLALTAGAEVAGTVLQRKRAADTATYIGSGKVAELSLTGQAEKIDLFIFDDELSGAQIRNLEDELSGRVIDRTTLILDIFAQRAQSHEGKLQVELAQLKYRLPRLTGMGSELSRLGGGIGTRGPGETKLENDRRHIRRRISELDEEIAQLAKQRKVRRQKRERGEVPVVALVGYTNAGKSTLLNALCGADAFVENKLFATLDPISRRLPLTKGECLIVDTVGFIDKLPHDLIDAFRSTLEEAAYADLLVHVVDSASPEARRQTEVVDRVLGELGAGNKPVITAWNKADVADGSGAGPKNALNVSAKRGDGLEALRALIEKELNEGSSRDTIEVPYSRGDVLAYIKANSEVFGEEYSENNVVIDIKAKDAVISKAKAMIEKA